MRGQSRQSVLSWAAMLLAIAWAAEAHASPDEGDNCTSCHRVSRSNGMTLEGFDSLTGGLKTYEVTSGEIAHVGLNVTDGHDVYAVAIGGLDDPGVENNAALDYSVVLGTHWADRGDYYTLKDIQASSASFNFNLEVNPATRPDLYLLKSQLVGRNGGQWSQVEDFYLRVLADDLLTLVAAGAEWYYLDDGSDLATAWRDTFHPAWKKGVAQLGYGNDGEATAIGFGLDPNDKHVTSYFQKTFDLADPVDGLTLKILYDDGAAVYLNGVEIGRVGLDPDAPYDRLAAPARTPDVENQWHSFLIDPDLMIGGTNLLAVEVHQADKTDDDLRFALKLQGTPATLTSLDWDGLDDGNWHAPDHWIGDTPGGVPDKRTRVQVWVDNTVNVAADASAYSVSIEGGRLVVGPDATLDVFDHVAGLEVVWGELDLSGTVKARSVWVLPPGGLDLAATGRLEIDGQLTMLDGSTFTSELGPASNGLIAVTGSVFLNIPVLKLNVSGVIESGIGSAVTRTIITAGHIDGTFAEVPEVYTNSPYPDVPRPAADPSPPVEGHMGDGVFFRGVKYPEEGGPVQVDVELLIARQGDGNADGVVDAADISQLVARFNSDAAIPRNRFWFDMDTAGHPVTGRSDGYVDGADLSAMVAGWTGDPGPAEAGTAVSSRGNVLYNPATGEFTVSVDNVMSWTLRSDGRFTGPDVDAVRGVLPWGDPSNLPSANLNTIGEGGFGAGMTYTNVLLGALTEPGTDPNEFSVEYVVGYGQPIRRGTVTVIPEPGTPIMLAAAALGLLLLSRRRQKRAA